MSADAAMQNYEEKNGKTSECTRKYGSIHAKLVVCDYVCYWSKVRSSNIEISIITLIM